MSMLISLKLFAIPPFFPKNETVLIFLFFAALIAFKTFSELPDVDRDIKTSPELPRPSNVLEKIFSKPKSFPQAVRTEEF